MAKRNNTKRKIVKRQKAEKRPHFVLEVQDVVQNTVSNVGGKSNGKSSA